MKTFDDILRYIETCPDYDLFVADLFCGAGGESTGIEEARIDGRKVAKVILCINHDANAILSHNENHPDALHFMEDIRTLDLTRAVSVIRRVRQCHPNARILLHASLECTNFSKAKGGMSRNPDSRTLAEHLYRYIESFNPDYIQIENVEEFLTHGPVEVKVMKTKEGHECCPLDKIERPETEEEKRLRKSQKKRKRKKYDFLPVYVPVKRLKGTWCREWRDKIADYGYKYEYKILNAADYGAYTSRKRYFGIFAAGDLPVAFPEPTHGRDEEKSLFRHLKKWMPVRDCLDFSDEGESIFARKKPLSDKTLERIYAGLIKFVAGGKDNFLSAYYGVTKNFNRTYEQTARSVDEPCGVVTTANRFAKVQAQFLSKYYSGHPESKNFSVEEPAHTVTPVDHHALISASFIQQRNSGNPKHKVVSVERPARTVTATGGNQELVQPVFLARYNGQPNQEVNAVSADAPSPTLTVKDRLALVSPFFMNYYSGGGQHTGISQPCPTVMPNPKQRIVSCKFIDQQFGNSKPAGIERPAGCITANPKYNLVSCRHWVMNTHYTNVGSPVTEPLRTVTANRKWRYLMNPQYCSSGGSVDSPCFTLIARMDKKPPYLVSTETGQIAIEIYDTDSEPARRIKEFMALYGIMDIKMRMLRIRELMRIMGFPRSYVLIGTQEQKKKYIGNAVEVTQARRNCEALVSALREKAYLKSVS
jgi:DNA (cytosine-5)-methyltransferase 1